MDKNNTSLTLFNDRRQADHVSTKDLLKLLEAMKQELMLLGNSPLLSAAFQRCSYHFSPTPTPPYPPCIKYIPTTYRFTDDSNYSWYNMSAYNAWMLFYWLSKYLQRKDIKPKELKSWQEYFSQDAVPIGVTTKELETYVHDIDVAVLRARYKAFSLFTDDMEMAGSNVSRNARSEIDALLSKAREDASAITAAAAAETGKLKTETDRLRAVADTLKAEVDRLKAEAEKTLADAQTMRVQADAAKASAKGARVKAEAAQTQVPGPGGVRPETAEPKRPAEISPRQELRIEDGLAELRRALMDTNVQMRKLEDSILESGRDETIRQLLELYNLIADSRDSALELARKASNLDPQNVARNLKEFLEMITGFMISYGVTVHTGAPGDPLNTKTQEVRNSPAQYDPRRAAISASLRSGFVLDDVVLQKEWVQLK